MRLIAGYLFISNNPELLAVSGFVNLTHVSEIIVSGNPILSFSGFDQLDHTGTVSLLSNSELQTINAFAVLEEVVGDLRLDGHPALESVVGFGALTRVGSLLLYENVVLQNVDAFSSLTHVTNSLQVFDNDALTTLDGLSHVVSVAGDGLVIFGNAELCSINGTVLVDYPWNTIVTGAIIIAQNGQDCGCIFEPCQNNGTCIPVGDMGFLCNCTVEYTGPVCDVKVTVCD